MSLAEIKEHELDPEVTSLQLDDFMNRLLRMSKRSRLDRLQRPFLQQGVKITFLKSSPFFVHEEFPNFHVIEDYARSYVVLSIKDEQVAFFYNPDEKRYYIKRNNTAQGIEELTPFTAMVYAHYLKTIHWQDNMKWKIKMLLKQFKEWFRTTRFN